MDLDRLKQDLFNCYWDRFINAGVLLFFLFLAVSIYGGNLGRIAKLKEQLNAEQKKNQLITVLGHLSKQAGQLKQLLLNKDISATANLIRNIARDNAVRILFFKPQAERDYSLYVKHSYEMTIACGDSHSLGRFIAALESSPDFYFVEYLNMPVIERARPGYKKTEIAARIGIATVSFKVKDAKYGKNKS